MSPRRLFALVVVLAASLLLRLPQVSAQNPKARVAVMNLENNSTWGWWGDNLGAAAADEFVTQLFKTGKFTVIERSQLQTIMEEQNLGQSGRVDASTAAEIGRLLGVQAILTGSITKFSIKTVSGGFGPVRASYSEAESALDVRLIDSNTGEILLAEDANGKKRMGGGTVDQVSLQRSFDSGVAQEALRPAVQNIVKKLAKESGRLAAIQPPVPPAQIVGVRNDQVYIDRGKNFGVTVGQRFEVQRVVDEIRAPDGTLLDSITDKVGTIEVVRVLGQSSICRIVEGEAAEGDTVTGS